MECGTRNAERGIRLNQEAGSCQTFASFALHWIETLFFHEDCAWSGAALKHHSARHGLGSKTVEQELTEGTEVLRYLGYLLF
jgi:hypothetical protein